MGSPIFDATFGTGRFRSEEPMKGGDAALPRPEVLTQGPGSECDRSGAAPSPEPQDVQKLISELRELGELYATDDVSNAYPGVGELMQQAAAALAQSDAKSAADAGLIEVAEWFSTAASRFEEAADALRSEYKTYARQMDRWAGDTRERARLFRILSRAADRGGK